MRNTDRKPKGMTLAEARNELAYIAAMQNGRLSNTKLFVDLDDDQNVLGYGVAPGRINGTWVIVSVPRD